jgi:DNA-binding NarL/FixJ family response regulator
MLRQSPIAEGEWLAFSEASDARRRLQDCFGEIERLFEAMRLDSEVSACAERRQAALALRAHIRATAALASLVCAADDDTARRNCSTLFSKPRHSLYALIGDFVGSSVNVRRRIAPQFIDDEPSAAAAQNAENEKLKQLTLREREVLDHLVRGHANKIIAYKMDIRQTTVKAHVTNIMRKLGVNSRGQAVALFR